MKEQDLKIILEQHQLWLECEQKEGSCADLTGADITGARLLGADLTDASFAGAEFF